jgi:hypothetical protein
VQMTITRLVTPFEFPLRGKIGDQNIDLGQALLDASNFTVKLGKVNQVVCDIGVGLPSELNTMFGEIPDGSAATEIFNTYKRKQDSTIDQESIVKLRVGLNTSGVSVQIVTSPIAAITLRTDATARPGATPSWARTAKTASPSSARLHSSCQSFRTMASTSPPRARSRTKT